MSAAEYLPSAQLPTLQQLREAAATCRGCDLWKDATQTVFGDGDRHATVMLVGEQPGDREDIEGEPFVGPAGKLLDRALSEAGIDRDSAYVTSAVKHFKWEPRGKRRLHKTPARYEIAACRPWLQAELLQVKPKLVVAMGSSAASALLERSVKILSERGQILSGLAGFPVAITVHPSSILRVSDHGSRESAMQAFVGDLKLARESFLV